MSESILNAIRRLAATSPDAVALTGDGGDLSYVELLHRTDTLAAWLRSRGVRIAGLWGQNSAEWIIADLAAWQAGATLVPLPPFFSSAQLCHVLKSAQLSQLIVCGDHHAVAPILGSAASPVEGIRLDRLEHSAGDQAQLPEGICKITFTSGTTGTPKGVCLRATMLEAVTRALAQRIHQAPGLGDALQTHFTLLPLSTLLENIAGVYVPLLLGKTISVRSGATTGLLGSSELDLSRLLRVLQSDQPNSLIVLPQIVRALVHAAERGWPVPPSLRFVAVGGAPTPVSLLVRARELGLPVYEGYGLSECASVVALNAPASERNGSVGRVLDHVRVRIERGSIQVAGNVFAGYLGESIDRSEEWLDTGDLGHLDDDGFLYISGRRKTLIITSYGRNVSPEWLEAELSVCPSIAQVMVIGDAQPFCCAIVVPSPSATSESLQGEIARVNSRLPDYARIRRFLMSSERFTQANGCLTDNGRLRREVIAERLRPRIEPLFANPSSTTETGATHDVF